MFRVVLETQWKWTRGMILVATLTAFALPLLSMRDAARALDDMNARELLARMQSFGTMYAVTAAFIGLVVAAMAWTSDHAGRHVYALSLPIERWRYVAMRFGAGALTIVPTAIALWAGSIVAVAAHEIPAGLESHPAGLALRFTLAALVAYALFFAISSATRRTAGVILAILGGLICLELIGETMDLPLRPLSLFIDLMVHRAGTLGVFNGRWMLIDV